MSGNCPEFGNQSLPLKLYTFLREATEVVLNIYNSLTCVIPFGYSIRYIALVRKSRSRPPSGSSTVNVQNRVLTSKNLRNEKEVF